MSKVQDFEHHTPRSIDKKKHHRSGFSEDAQDTRKNRISFKNYVRGLREQEPDDVGEQWIVEHRNIDGNEAWTEIAGPFLGEDDAQSMMDELLDVAGEQDQYRVTLLEEK